MENTKTGVIKKAASIIIRGFEGRFPITNSMVAAALLDPSAQHLEAVRTWLFKSKKTRSEVLRDAMIEFNINIDNEQQQPQKQQNDKHISDIRLVLLKKHSIFSNASDNDFENEVNNFVHLKEEVHDVLSFWRAQEINYPKLAKLAKVLLSKPTSSAKSESAFSVAGVLISKKRALIEPLRAEKVLFIHDNYQLCKSAI